MKKINILIPMYKIAVLSSTNGTNLQSMIDAKNRGELKDVEISCLITDQPRCGAVMKAEMVGIPTHPLAVKGKSREEFDWEVMDVLSQYNVDLIVLGGYMRIIGHKMVQRYADRIINVHPSLLPQFGGKKDFDIHRSVIESGQTETGITIHKVDQGLDTGPILIQKSIPVKKGETPESLKKRVQDLEKEWYPKVVQMFANGEIR